MPSSAAAVNWKAIRRIADRLEPAMRKRFLFAVRQLQDRLAINDLAMALARGDIARAEIVVNAAGLPDELRPALRVLNEGFEKGGREAARQLSGVLGEALSFDVVNPSAVRFAQREAAHLVVEVTRETKKAIRSIIVRSIREGIPPYDAARMLRPLIGLTNSSAQAVMNYRAALIDQGLLMPKVVEFADKYAAKLIRQRALTIARTETLAAANRGQQALWRQAVRDKRIRDPKKVWIVTPDDRLCPVCEPLADQAVKLNEFFVTALGPVNVPPAHPNCRCAVSLQV